MTRDLQWRSEIRAAETAFFLDVDGTLLGFKERAEDVVADPALIELLSRLIELSDGAVAFVSGRMVPDLDRIAAPLVLPAGGVHGADLRFADGRRQTMAGAALDQVRARIGPFVAARPGLRIEDKGAAIAVHFRAAPERADEVHRFLVDAVEGHDLAIQNGKMVAEVKSSSGHKGTAIELLMDTNPFKGRRPLFVGDDLTDEHGFEAVNALGGVSIKVGPTSERSVAHYRLADVDDVRAFLILICRSASENGQTKVS